MAKILSEDKALELTEMLLKNDKKIKNELEEKIDKIDIGGSTSESFDRDDLTAVTVGGLNSGSSIKDKTTKEVLESILFPYQKPTVSFTISPNTTIYETGNTISRIVFSITATKKSNNIQSIKIYNGSTLLTTITDNVSNGGNFSYTYNCSITSNVTLKIEVSDGENTVSATNNIVFTSKSYYGFVNDGTIIDASTVKGLQNSALKTSKSFTYGEITCSNSKIVYAYPQSFGALTSILDASGFEYIDSYSRTNISIDGINYYVYTLIEPVSLDNFKQLYK